MRIHPVGTTLALALATAISVSPTQAQSRSPDTMVELTPYAGYMRIGDYAQGPFGTNLSNRNGYVVGAQLALKVLPGVSLVGNVAHAGADLQVGAPILGGLGVGNSKLWLYDAGIQLGLPAMSNGGSVGVSPFIQLGAGGIHHDVGASLINVRSTNLAYNAGLGADVMFGRSLGLRLLARDYIGRFDAKEAIGFDLETDVRHNIALSAGLKLAF